MEKINLAEVCRICLTKHKDMCLIEDDVVEKLSDCASVQLPEDSLICDFCKNEIYKWHSFKQQVLNSMEVAKYIEETIKKKEEAYIDDNHAVIEEYFIKVEDYNQFEEEEVATCNEEEIDNNANTKEEMDIVTLVSDSVLQKLSPLDEQPEDPLSQAEENKYQCDLCHKSFNSKNGIIWHKKLHSALKLNLSKECERFPCPYCSMIYEKKSSLVDHVKWKHNCTIKNKLLCNICDIEYKSEQEFKMHVSIYNEDKPFMCKICNIVDLDPSAFITHHRVHTEYPHKCPICNKTFRRKAYLRKHTKDKH